MGAAVLYHHPSSLEHDTGPHPEQPARIPAVLGELERRGWAGLEPRLSPQVERAALEAIHPAGYVDSIERFCAAGGGALDVDTVASPGSFDAALHAAGGAVALVDALLGGEARTGVSVHRPPGHHAENERAMGFCLFNNVAVAAQRARDAHGAQRVAIVDFDVHHGNGTNDIFHSRDDVFFASLHEWPLYPGTGPASDSGSGAGVGFTLNLPVPGGSGDEVFCSLVEHVVAPRLRELEPALVLISAGFDAHAEDPLATCRVSDEGYAVMTGSLRRAAEACSAPVGVVLEGGYALGALARGFAAVAEVVTAATAPAAPALAVHPLAEQALAAR